MTRPPVAIEPRKPLSRKEYLHLILKQEGRCGCGCGVRLDPMTEGVIDEHRVPLQQGGANALTNRELWRKPCSRAKDKRDATNTAKCKRLAGETGAGPKRPIPNRGFDQTMTRGFDGKVRPRRQKNKEPVHAD